MDVKLVKATKSDRVKIDNLWHYYIYDMSEYMRWNVAENGSYSNDVTPLDEYWLRDDHYPFLIYCDGELAGFSLLRKYPADDSLFDIGQFFILRKFKRTGIGLKAFQLSVGLYPGQWLTRVLKGNTGASQFWTSVIGKVTGNQYQLTIEKYGEVDMHFIRYEISNAK